MLNPKNTNDIKQVIRTITGSTVTQDLFMSTSFDIYTAQKYANKKDVPRLLWTITAPKNSKAIDTRYLSSKKWEEELLFDKGQKLEINEVKYNKKDKIWEINASVLAQ